ncbi:uncharacterized protein LOC143691514 isoform X3 [Tamandua tetradactyla]|uniref:uncharacterized protein LOC143691514 isoform X3 n=1 Tax=Tamandua tetradactyla TaxID=48850 RepID=UPI004053A8F2
MVSRDAERPQGPPPDDKNQDNGPQQKSFPPGDGQYNPPPKNQQEPAQSGGPNNKDLPPSPGNYQRPPPARGCVKRANANMNPSYEEPNNRKRV